MRRGQSKRLGQRGGLVTHHPNEPPWDTQLGIGATGGRRGKPLNLLSLLRCLAAHSMHTLAERT